MNNYELDNSWITKFKEEEEKYNDFYKEKPTSVKLYFMYTNRENFIEFIKTETILLNNEAKIEKNYLISIIKKNQICHNIKYKLLSLLKFNINIEPLEVLNINTSQNNYLTIERYLHDIHFEDTVCIFQDINSLFFIFYEPNSQRQNMQMHNSQMQNSQRQNSQMQNSQMHNSQMHNTTKKIYLKTNKRKTIRKRS